jgi:hypothetical protein
MADAAGEGVGEIGREQKQAQEDTEKQRQVGVAVPHDGGILLDHLVRQKVCQQVAEEKPLLLLFQKALIQGGYVCGGPALHQRVKSIRRVGLVALQILRHHSGRLVAAFQVVDAVGDGRPLAVACLPVLLVGHDVVLDQLARLADVRADLADLRELIEDVLVALAAPERGEKQQPAGSG